MHPASLTSDNSPHLTSAAPPAWTAQSPLRYRWYLTQEDNIPVTQEAELTYAAAVGRSYRELH